MFKITKKEFVLALVIALGGLVFSAKSWLVYLDGLNPVEGLGIYYVVIFGYMFFLSKLGLTVWNIKIEKPLQVLGTVMIIFSIFVTIDWTSTYVNQVVKGSVPDNMSSIYLQDEDGAVVFVVTRFIPLVDENLFKIRIISFGIIPFIIAIVGGLFVDRKISVGNIL